ncbi:hypothetical protein WICPIJ_009874 [Wickerhamomyces pijperi]|uniref:AAA+ ATPase domain-containing protein n=1 Tax=Wickerhamomyces pijperi TaxID=599730 RepID=A0A9P8PKK9_WICPI|nr:hypothetical protein WICPIJ_009874 [Wickerhamomyces pijperi]
MPFMSEDTQQAPEMELPFLQLPTGSSSFLFQGSSSTTTATTPATTTTDESNIQNDPLLSPETQDPVTSEPEIGDGLNLETSGITSVSTENVDFDDLNDLNDEITVSATEPIHEISEPMAKSQIEQQQQTQDSHDFINFRPESHQEIRYQNKQVKLSNGRTFTLRKKHKSHKPMLNNLELSREESYGLNINNLYSKLETERLQNHKTNEKSYMNNLKVKNEPGSTGVNKQTETLWVEKWRPRKYMDFIGNEQTNRKIIHWFKQWDRVVFEKNFKPITESSEKLPQQQQSSSSSSSKSFSRYYQDPFGRPERKPITESSEKRPQQQSSSSKPFSRYYQDPFGRPERKVLLISGAPGLGKTTISHIIAKMCGYEVMEINASDERSGQKVRDKVTNSLSSLTFSGKPVCLVADEVDGAAEFGFVKVISDILADDKKTVQRFQRSGDSTKFFKEKGKNRPKFLLRPIVAICNDVYAPALEKLRPQCEMIGFKQASEKTLIDRLKFICHAEKLPVPSQKLKEIVTLTDYDIRSCLNLLQFGGANLDGSDSRKKDMTLSWYSIVSQLFQKDARCSKQEQFKRLNALISVNGNFDKIIHGCFQTYTDMHYQDLKLSKPSKISDWLYFSDLMSRTQFDSTAGDISWYSKETALQFHELFSDLSNKSNLKIKSDYEHFEMKKNNLNIVKLLFNNSPVQLRTLIKLQTIPTDILPYLPYILTPDLSKLHIPQFQQQLQHKPQTAIDALNAFQLQMLKTKDEESYNEIYKTYPDFTPLVKFNSADIKRQYNKQTATFPTLITEIDRLRTLKRKHIKDATSSSSSSAKKSQNVSDEEDQEDDDVGETSFQILKNQYEKIAEQEQRAKRQKRETATAEGRQDDLEVKVWVKYNEGFSNAVRKRVRWGDLFN